MKRFLFAILCILLLPISTHAKTWDEAISDVQSLAEKYSNRADRLDDVDGDPVVYQFGNSAAYIDLEEHFCAILGRRLGHEVFIKHLEPPLPKVSSDAREMARTAASLSNWVRSAERFRNMTQPERAHYWNLECVGQHGINASAGDGRSDGTLFYSVERNYLWVYGDVVDGFAAALRKALDANPGVDTIGLGSGGGRVFEAIEAGQMIRDRGLGTQLTGPCLSACPLVLAGGISRVSLPPHSLLGFHQVSAGGVAVSLNDSSYREIESYLNSMGVNGAVAVKLMQLKKPHEMGMVGNTKKGRNFLCKSGFITGYGSLGSDIC